MTLTVRTRSQANRISSEPDSPEPKRSRTEEQPQQVEKEVSPELVHQKEASPELLCQIEVSPKVRSPSPEKVLENDDTVTNVENENEITNATAVEESVPSSPKPEKDPNSDAGDKNYIFPTLIVTEENKKDDDEEVVETVVEKATPDVIQLDDGSSGASTPTPNASLPRLSVQESGKESDFGNRKRPPFRRPILRRIRRRNLQSNGPIVTTVTPQQLSALPPQAQLLQQTNLPFKPLTPIWNMIINFPKEISNEYKPFYEAMCQWEWKQIDDVEIPVIFRGSQKFVAYSIAHIKLFSKFPTNVNITQHIPQDVKLESIPMTETEAWMLNFINTIVSNYTLGMQIFQNGDNLVELNAIEVYYLFAKKHYLEDLMKIYDGAIPQEAINECKNIIGAIFNLKKQILTDLKIIYEQIKIKHRPINQLNTFYS